MSGPKPRPGVLEIHPYVGGESAIKGKSRVIKLASNEGALGPSPRAVAAFQDTGPVLHRYPDGGALKLRQAIADAQGLSAERIVCGAGSDELLSLLAYAYAGPGDEVLYSEHGFLMYPIAAHAVGATPVKAPETDLTTDVDSLLSKVTEKTRVVYIANPNNPTGTYLPQAELVRLRAGLPSEALLVLDAAYAEFVERDDYDAGTKLVDDCVGKGDNVVMTRTFSKIYALGGLRLGWAYCPPVIADVLNRVRGPFNVSSAAQAAGIAAMQDTAFTDQSRIHTATWRTWATEQVRALGLQTTDSVANFILIRFPSEAAAEACNLGLKDRGIIVRLMRAYGLPDSLRVSIGTEEEMHAFIDALKSHLAEAG